MEQPISEVSRKSPLEKLPQHNAYKEGVFSFWAFEIECLSFRFSVTKCIQS